MRATINIEEFQYGLFRRVPRWRVVCKIEFTPEEIAIVRQRNLGDLHIYTQHVTPDDDFEVDLAEVVKSGIWSTFNTPVGAKNFEAELANSLLPTLKNYLSASADVGSGPTTLEF